jgi:hypothetical protein
MSKGAKRKWDKKPVEGASGSGGNKFHALGGRTEVHLPNSITTSNWLSKTSTNPALPCHSKKWTSIITPLQVSKTEYEHPEYERRKTKTKEAIDDPAKSEIVAQSLGAIVLASAPFNLDIKSKWIWKNSTRRRFWRTLLTENCPLPVLNPMC